MLTSVYTLDSTCILLLRVRIRYLLFDVLASLCSFVPFPFVYFLLRLLTQGFDVNVQTSEEHHKQTILSGKLLERTKEHLLIMQKGRKLKIPRNIVIEVKMPPSRFED